MKSPDTPSIPSLHDSNHIPDSTIHDKPIQPQIRQNASREIERERIDIVISLKCITSDMTKRKAMQKCARNLQGSNSLELRVKYGQLPGKTSRVMTSTDVSVKCISLKMNVRKFCKNVRRSFQCKVFL